MNKLCVVTAAHKGDPEWVLELAASIRSLALAAPNWDIVWSIQEDDPDARFSWLAETFDFVSYGANARHFGVAVTRNVALSRHPDATAFVNMDQDDVFVVDGFTHTLSIFEAHPEVVWVSGRVDDLLDDGTIEPFPQSIAAGPTSPGGMSSLWLDEHKPPAHTIGFACRPSHWQALGGWVAHPTMSDDLAALMAVTEVWGGWVHHQPVALYRKHRGNNSQTDAHLSGKPLTNTLVRQRIAAIQKTLTTGAHPGGHQ